MEILSAQEVREKENEKKLREEKRVANLLTEEARLVRSVNGLRENADSIKLETDVLISKRDSIQNELSILEAKKTEVLKPIFDVRDEADRHLALAISRESDVVEAYKRIEIHLQHAQIEKSEIAYLRAEIRAEMISKEAFLQGKLEDLTAKEDAFLMREVTIEQDTRTLSEDSYAFISYKEKINANISDKNIKLEALRLSLEVMEKDLKRRENNILAREHYKIEKNLKRHDEYVLARKHYKTIRESHNTEKALKQRENYMLAMEHVKTSVRIRNHTTSVN